MQIDGNLVSVVEIDRAIAGRSWRLQFDRHLETLFRHEKVAANAGTLLTCTLVTCALYPLFLISDFRQVPDVFGYLVLFRIGIFVPLSMFLAYLFWRDPHNAMIEPLGSIIAFLSVVLILVALSMSDSPHRINYAPGFVIGMIYGTVVYRQRFAYSLSLIIAIVGSSLSFLAFCKVAVGPDLLRYGLFYATSGILMLLGSYTYERASRLAFLHGLRGQMLNEQLEAVAMTDPLTGVGNRRRFETAAAAVWADAETRPRRVAIIMLDLDYFKLFNDRHGHLEGDNCLVTIAREIETVCSDGRSILSRFGGEELVVLVPDSDEPQVRLLAETLRLAVRSLGIAHPAVGDDALVTASLGVALGATSDVTTADLLRRADRALYAAKGAGRDCVRFAEASTHAPESVTFRHAS